MAQSEYLNDRLSALCRDSDSGEVYTDAEIDEVSRILEELHLAASKCPRTYIVLRAIGHLELLETLTNLGFDDQWFPVEPRSLPASLSPDIRTSFTTAQSLILTKSLDVEQGRHRHFTAGESLPFEIKNRLGNGGYSQVDRIQSRISNRSYALKRIRRRNVFGNDTKAAMKTFRAEVEIMRSLRYRHIVQFIGSYTDKTFLGIITSPVADMDLAVFLKKLCGCVETGSRSDLTCANEMSSSLRSFFGCLAAALAYLHDNRVRHKDIKPQNILISQGTVLFTDFGLSRHFADGQGSTTSGLTATTPRYSPPEGAAYEQRNSSADIWSLGCVFLEMLAALQGHDVDWVKDYFLRQGTQEPHYRSNASALQLLLNKYEAEAARPDRIPVKWIRQMMAIDRAARWTAAFLLQQIISGDELETSSTFCGICCMGNEESDSHDSLVDEPTSRPFAFGSLPVGSDRTMEHLTLDPGPEATSMPEPKVQPTKPTNPETLGNQPEIPKDAPAKAIEFIEEYDRRGVAWWDYTKSGDDEIDLKGGEIITKIDLVVGEWWRGRNAAGEYGYFPKDYVKLIFPGSFLYENKVALVTSEYTAKTPHELSLPKGAVIVDLEYIDGFWALGTYNNEHKLFPVDHVEEKYIQKNRNNTNNTGWWSALGNLFGL